MVKVATKYVLSLCILLLGGYGYLSAHTLHNTFAADASAQEYEHVGLQHSKAPNSDVLSARNEKEQGNDFLEFAEEEEVEENKESSTKKYLEISDYYAVLLDTKQALFYSHFIKSRLLFCERNSHHSNEESLNVEFGVFLI